MLYQMESACFIVKSVPSFVGSMAMDNFANPALCGAIAVFECP
jgi:hypothetical protein